MPFDNYLEISKKRSYNVVKSNDMIQNARFNLSLQEQRIVLYLISKIVPEDIEIREQEFVISEFYNVCGFKGEKSGKHYENVKKSLKDLRDKSIWIKKPDGSNTTFSWIDQLTEYPGTGKLTIKFGSMLKPYLLQLSGAFTQFELIYTLAMHSSYSIRIYEILKSYEFQKEIRLEVQAMQEMLYIKNFKLFGDFKRTVLDVAVNEINIYSDIIVSFKTIKTGRKITHLLFNIKKKTGYKDRLETIKNIKEKID